MAVTRIKNNQITDGTIEAGKIANTTITGGKLANDLTYGSNLTISGNLTVNGTTTTVDTTNTVIADPLMLLSRGATGAASVDSGLIVERGDDDNVAFVWDESEDKWVAAITSAEDGTTAGNITIDSYANLKVGSIETTSGVDITGDLDVDNININGNTISSTDTNGAINLTPNGTGEVVASTLTVSDLTDNRVVIAGTSGALEDDANFTFDGTTLALTAGMDITGDLDVDNININGNTIISTDTNGDINITPDGTGETVIATAAVSDLTSGRVVLAGTSGALEDSASLTFDGTDLTVASAVVSDLTDNRIVVAGTSGALEDDANLTWDGSDMGVTGGLNVTGDLAVDNIAINGNTVSSTDTNGAINLTPDGTGEVVAATLTVSDITDNRVVIGGTSGALEDDANLTYDGTDLSTNSLIVGDLTDNRVLIAGTSGAVEDDANFTFNGTTLALTAGMDITGDLDVDNININGNTIVSTDTNGDINITPDGTGDLVLDGLNWPQADGTAGYVLTTDGSGQLSWSNSSTSVVDDTTPQLGGDLDVNGFKITSARSNEDIEIEPNGTGEVVLATAVVSDLTNNRVVIVGTNGELEDDSNFTYDGTDLTVNSAIVGDLTDNRVVIAGTSGALEDDANFTYDGTDLTVNSAIVSDLTDNRVVIAGSSGALEDDANFTFNGSILALTGAMDITGDLDVDNININGNTIVSTDTNGDINLTPNGTGDVVVSTIEVSDLTSGRIVTAGTSGALEDSATLLWDGTDLTAGSAIISDLTDNRVVIAGTSGALEDDGNFTFDGTTITMTAAVDVTGDLDVDNLNLNGNTISSTDTNGAVTVAPNGTGTVELGGTSTVVNINGTTGSSGTGLGALVVDGGVGIAENLNVGGNIVVAGNLTVEGTTTTVDSVTTQVVDPIFQIGGGAGGAALSADDDKDRGMSAKYHTGSEEKTAFWGFDDSTGNWTFVPDATISGEVVSGSKGTLDVGSILNANLTDNRVVIAGTNGVLEDDANFTFNGTTLALTAAMDITGDLDVDNININGNTISSTDTNGDVNITPDGTGDLVLDGLNWPQADGTAGYVLQTDGSGQLSWVAVLTDIIFDTTPQLGGDLDTNGFKITSARSNEDIEIDPAGTGEVVLSTAVVSDLTDNRVVIAGTSGALEDDGNLTYDGTDLSTNSLVVSDLTNNRVVIAGTGGAVEDDSNFTFDGTTLALTAGMDITGDLDVDNININGNTIISTDTNGDINLTPNGTGDVVVSTIEVSDLTATRVTYAGTSGALVDSANMTFDGTDLTVASAIVSDLTDNRIVVAGSSGALEDDANLTWDGSDMGVTGGLNVTGDLAVDNIAINGNTISSTDTNGAINLTPDGTGEVVAASATVSDLTSGRIVTAGTSGALEDSASLTWDGTDLTAGSAIISDLTDNRVVIAGTSGALEDDANFTFNGTTLALTAAMDITGDLDVDNININGNTIISTDTNGDVNITPDGTGEVVASTLTVSDLTDNRLVVAGTSGALEDDANLTWSGTALAVTGGVDVTGDLDVDNININGNTIISTDTNGDINLTPNGTGETVIATAAVSDLTSGRIVTAGTSGALEDSATLLWDGTDLTAGSAIVSDLTAGRVVLAGTSGAIEDSGNLTFDGTTLTVTGNIAVDNITLDGNDITATSGGKVTVNDAGADVDFTVEGDTDTALLHVDAGTDTVNIGTATATTGAKVKINSTDSMIIPTGSTVQRPVTGVEGMLRINSSTYKMEYYANSEWKTADSAFTVIASETFDGDDSTVAFTLSDSQTTASCVVSINGVLQLPVSAYGVSGTTLTFTEAPASGDKIEVRKLTTTTTITDIASADSYQTVEATDATGVQISTGSSAQNLRWTFNTSGHLIPNGDELFDIGDASNKVRSLYVGGGTVFLGDLQLKDNGDNSLGVFQSDGVTEATMSVAAENAAAVNLTATNTTDSTHYLTFAEAATGTEEVRTDTGLTYNPNSGLLTTAEVDVTTLKIGSTAVTATATELNYVDGVTSAIQTQLDAKAPLASPTFTGTVNGANLTLSGDLTVNGTTTTIATTNTVVSDNLMELNNGAASNANDSGIVIERGSTGDNAFMGWDESADKFIVGTTTATGASTGDLTITTGTLVANLEGDVTGAVTGNADTATTATNVTATANNATNETTYLTFVDGATGAQGIETDTGLTYNPSSNTLTTSVFSGTATTAQYADLAEMYASDAEIEAGTVVHFAGNGKVAPCDTDMCSKVAGIVSTDPAHLMNSSQEGVPLALAGRVPCKVTGTVNAGDLMVSAGGGLARAEANPALGTVIGKAIEDFSGEGEGVIEVLALMM